MLWRGHWEWVAREVPSQILDPYRIEGLLRSTAPGPRNAFLLGDSTMDAGADVERLDRAFEDRGLRFRTLTVGGTPGLNVRSATTTVEMREGQTLAIAGLLEDSYKATNVGDLPFLAKVFGRRDATRNETELIILVTPELVHPLEPEEVPPLPGFDVTEPTNCEFFLCGDIEGYPTRDYRSTVWPRLRKRYGGPAMTSGPFGHGQ